MQVINIKKYILFFLIFTILSFNAFSYIETNIIKFSTIANPVYEPGLIFWDNSINAVTTEDNMAIGKNLTGQTFNFYDVPTKASDTLFEIMGTRGVPQFLVQNGGSNQASMIVRSFLVVNQNNTLLNQSQNNLCGDWGFIHIDCNTSTTGADFGVTDDIEAKGIIYADQGLRSHASSYGTYLALKQRGQLYYGTNGTYNANTQYFCDYTFNSFNETNGWLVITEIGSIYNDATADLSTRVNSSCYKLSNNPTWINDIITPVSWKVTNNPDLIAVNGGFFEYYVGAYDQSGFKIKIINGTNLYGSMIDDKAGVDQHKSLSIITNINDKNGIIGLNQLMYSSVPIINKQIKMISLTGDASGMKNSTGTFIDLSILNPNNASGSTIYGMRMPSGLDALIKVGELFDVSKVYSNTVDITDNISGVSGPVTIFQNDNDYLYVGNTRNFTRISFKLTTPSSKTIRPLYYYCSGNNVYKTLTGASSTTNGFTSSGTLSFINPSDRGYCNKTIGGVYFSNTTSYNYIVIQRTQNNIVTPPVISNIGIASSLTSTFILKDDMLKLHAITAPPVICDASLEGGIYSDDDLNLPCFCTGANWVQMNDFTSVCS